MPLTSGGNLDEAMRELAVKFMCAFAECSDDIQQVIREMAVIVNSPDSDEDERAMAAETISEAIMPRVCDGQLGADLDTLDALAVANKQDGAGALRELEEEEETFSERLRVLLDQKGVTQEELAAKIGVGQSAISMMLNRSCRPQRRTINRIAQALGIEPEEIWPFG